jgi:hypothetical protein
VSAIDIMTGGPWPFDAHVAIAALVVITALWIWEQL